MTYRAFFLATLIGLAAAAQSHALDQQSPVITSVLTLRTLPTDPVLPPLPPPPPDPRPQTPSQPVVRREPTAVTLGWWELSTNDTSNSLERKLGKNGIWRVVAAFGPLSGFQEFTDTGLSRDTLYCWRARAANSYGSRTSKETCVYTKDGTGRPVVRAEIRLHTADLRNADTENSVAVLLNSAIVANAGPGGNKTWLDYARDDFERGADEFYDLNLDAVREIGDINLISIQKSGSDAWCLADFDLIVNGAVLYTKTFPNGCRWFDAAAGTNIFTVSFAQLRATPGWSTFDPTLLPDFPRTEIESRIESITGHAIHGTALEWGDLRGEAYVEVNAIPGQNALHVDLDLHANVNNAPDAAVDIQFDLVVSGGCNPDGSIDLSIEPTNVRVDADVSFLAHITQAFSCLAVLDEPWGCVENGVADAVRKALRPPSISSGAEEAIVCNDGRAHPWLVSNDGSISLG